MAPLSSLLSLVFISLLSGGTFAQDHVPHQWDHTCPLFTVDPVSFSYFDNSTALNQEICPTERTESCCNEAYYATVGTSDLFTVALDKMESVSDACRLKMKSLSCGICDSHQHRFTSSGDSEGRIRTCFSFCDALLDVCAGSTLDGTQVEAKYNGDGDYFCHDLFKGLPEDYTVFTVPDTASEHCFSEEKSLCTEDNYIGYYSECNLTAGTRSYFYQLKDGIDCHGGYSPHFRHHLPCDQECLAGTYLPPGLVSCAMCAPGTYSVGGGYLFDTWKTFPDVFEWDTYCERTTGQDPLKGVKILEGDCQGWIFNDTFIESSDILDDKQNSVLVARVRLQYSGSVSFTFKVDAEPLYDGLLFLIDDQNMMSYYASSAAYEERTFTLSAGIRTLKWIYFKDNSESQGEDQAYIHSIRITGAKSADTACTPCGFGTYSSRGSPECLPCRSNTFNDNSEQETCTPCPADQFSYIGAFECFPREPCGEEDYSMAYSPCVGGLRNKEYHFDAPVICDSDNYDLPSNEMDIECALCNPGYYRPEGTDSCVGCPDGTFSALGSDGCNECESGTFALKTNLYTQFDSYAELPGVITYCVGDCATDGWRLLSDDIDSGIGHGALADVYLETRVVLDSPGLITWNFTVICLDFCRYQFIDANVSGGSTTNYVSQGALPGPHTFSQSLAAGEHLIQVVFSKYVDTFQSHRENRLIIHNFEITGVATGGASKCSPCSKGTYSLGSGFECDSCPIGTYSSEEGASVCDLCPVNTYSNVTGATECNNCGPNTVSREDRLDCDYLDCAFSPREGLEYDLSPIQSPEDMYGPIWDAKGHAFYLNPCTRRHENHSCFDEDGDAIMTHACQLLPAGFSMDLGAIQGYLPLEDPEFASNPDDPARSGLVMTFEGGSLGCKNSTTADYPRESRITFICDPSAGIGYPEPVEDVEYFPCKYQFKWKSLYACPICTKEDYTPVYGPCIDESSLLQYVPKGFPNRCHDGFTPRSEEVECTVIGTNCSAGYYFPLAAEVGDECVPASEGKFSIGGGIYVDIFESYEALPPVFNTEGSWDPLGELIRSGRGDTKFSVTVFLVQPGYVSFRHKVVANGLETPGGGFYFGIDESNKIHGSLSTSFNYITDKYVLQPGTHILSWRFVGGVTPSNSNRGFYAVVDQITIFGTEYAARQDTDCREGFFQSQTGQISCDPCPPNTKSASGMSSCSDCPTKTYSLEGSSECELETRCELSDYTIMYTPCMGGKRTKFLSPVLPKTCYDHSEVPANTIEDCPPCPIGFVMNDDICDPCPRGKYFNNGDCVDVPAGSESYYEISYFSETMTHKILLPIGPWGQGEWPDNFRTSCVGRCGTNGWQIVNNSAESGFHSVQAEVDSLMFLEAVFHHEGSISFSYMLTARRTEDMAADDGLAGIQFFIDGTLMREVEYHPEEDVAKQVVFSNIPAGRHVFEWVFHQPLGTNRQKRVVVNNINVIGSADGSSGDLRDCPHGFYSRKGGVECEPCPPGYTSNSGAKKCDLCPENTITDEYGTAQCQSCGTSVKASPDHTYCDTNGCVFHHPESGRDFNVSALNRLVTVAGDKIYKISICEELGIRSRCFDANNDFIEDTHVCSLDHDNGVGSSSGSKLNVYFEGPELLRLRYTDGANCGAVGHTNTKQKTDIKFVCDPDVVTYVDPIVSSPPTPCRLEFQWNHISGCPVCDDSLDYETQLGNCKDGSQTVTKLRISRCNGHEIINLDDQKCTRTIGISLPITIVVAALLMILVVSVIVIIIRNKKMADRYQMLLSSKDTSAH